LTQVFGSALIDEDTCYSESIAPFILCDHLTNETSGVPGSGKTSLIHALAGELSLDIYVVSLSAKGMNDTMLMNLMGRIPQRYVLVQKLRTFHCSHSFSRCILLLEDLDAAFTRSTTRDAKSTGIPASSKKSSSSSSSNNSENDGNSLSLSGLLNALGKPTLPQNDLKLLTETSNQMALPQVKDGMTIPFVIRTINNSISSSLLFATTNHIDRLDEALRRPGRMDVWINFKYATKWQAEGIFKCFFPSLEDAAAAAEIERLAEERGETVAPKRKAYTTIPRLAASELAILAKQFADAIPENELSVSVCPNTVFSLT
jgi:chaperone BCS1